VKNNSVKVFSKSSSHRQRGYVLLTLMLFVAFLGIAAMAIAPTVAFQAQRDREEEMIHRGVQYSRAVRRYYKKFGRYPARLEELENTNNMRFLRKRYKDPISGKDFKLLHVGEVQMNFNPGIAGATQAAALGTLNQQQSSLNPKPPDNSALNSAPNSSPDDKKTGDTTGGDASDDKSQPNQGLSGNNLTGQTFGGGAIVGVVSVSKDKSIREFNKKKHYDQWQFIYDPSSDRGGLLTMPNQQSLQGGGMSQTGQPGQPGFGGLQPGTQSGQPAQFGQAPVNTNQPNSSPQ
jgi:type II secretory pathway pseudopilin PulG